MRPSDIKKTKTTLSKISEILGLSPEMVLNQAPSDLGQTLELLKLWFLINDEQGRAKALAYVRGISTGAALNKAAKQADPFA